MPTAGCQLCAILSLFREPGRARESINNDIRVNCSECGQAYITDDALDDILDRGLPATAVRGFIRNGNAQGQRRVQIDSDAVEELAQRALAMRGVPGKLDRVLLAVADRTPYAGSQAEFALEDDSPLFYAHDATELEFLFQELQDEGLIKYSGDRGHGLVRVKMLAAGWRLADTLRRAGQASRQCFVAMSFDEAQRPAFDAISRAIVVAGFLPYRIDEVHHADLIPMKILGDIRQSRFLVADLTAHKHGVYFEAGFALGLGIPVIWVCHADDRDGTHFDIKQYNTLFYSDLDHLENHLRERIRALIV